MSYFKAKMHQIRFWLGLCHRPRWELTVLPNLLAEFKGPTSKGRKNGKEGQGTVKGNGEYGKRGKGRKGRKRGEKR